MDSEAYLEPDFDPNTLKVAELRGILLKHDVDYPSSAKKAVLLDIFNQNIATQAHKLRTASSLVQPSSHGMIDAGQTPDRNEIGATPRRVRRSTRGATEDTTEDDDEALSRNTRRSVGRTPSRKRASDVEPQQFGNQPPPSTVRKTRKSIARLPEEETIIPRRLPDDTEDAPPDTPFSSYNPFQMGSPPPLGVGTPGADRRRTLGVPSTTKKRSTSSRRRTEGVQQPDVEDYATTSVGGSLKKRRQSLRSAANGNELVKAELVDDMEPGEEFEPAEAAELAQQPPQELVRRRPQAPGTGGNALLALVSIVLFAYAIWWRQEKIEVGYCGVGGLDMRKHDQNTFVELLRPECEPCPAHAKCYPGMELDCVDDYIKVNSYASLGGLWPIPPACVPDTEKERRVMIMSDAALDILRKNGAEQRCKEKFLSGDLELEGVSEADLRQVLYDRKASSLSDREFSELFRHALEDVSNREEVIVETDKDGYHKLKSTSLAALPFGCSARLFIAGSVARHRVEIIGMILLLIAGAKLRATLAYNKTYNSKVTKLVHIALSQLAINAHEHSDHPYIAVAHLRDQVLQHELNVKTRQHLWDGVEKVVEMNSNVRVGQKMVQGDIMKIWTWIGGRIVDGRAVVDEAEQQQQQQQQQQQLEWNRPPPPIPPRPIV
ncbi:hypothetical protein K440DRAFT_540887 [Wilcoxina mikolae CBS 423.85]|nr:hypothetical protein K440DRAFT_540887 [Wilcoxina mikolae CBS 423.85]